MSAGGVWLAVGVALASAALPAPAADADVAAQVELGRKAYTSYCTRCHGIGLVTGGLGFDLRSFPRDDRPRFDRAVSKGLRAMPAWEGVLKPGELDAMWAYIGAVNGWDAPAPAAK